MFLNNYDKHPIFNLLKTYTSMLPKNWNDITLEQYVAYYKTLSETPKNEDEEYKLVLKRLCYLTDLDFDYVDENITVQDVQRMVEFMKLPLPTKLITDFRINGRRFRVCTNPTLLKKKDFKNVIDACNASKMDFGHYMSAMNQHPEKLENLHKVLFQICKEVDWKGKEIEPDLNTIQETIEMFKQLPLKIINPISVFFCSLSENLTLVIQESLTSQMTKATELLQTEIDYLKDSDG